MHTILLCYKLNFHSNNKDFPVLQCFQCKILLFICHLPNDEMMNTNCVLWALTGPPVIVNPKIFTSDLFEQYPLLLGHEEHTFSTVLLIILPSIPVYRFWAHAQEQVQLV